MYNRHVEFLLMSAPFYPLSYTLFNIRDVYVFVNIVYLLIAQNLCCVCYLFTNVSVFHSILPFTHLYTCYF